MLPCLYLAQLQCRILFQEHFLCHSLVYYVCTLLLKGSPYCLKKRHVLSTPLFSTLGTVSGAYGCLWIYPTVLLFLRPEHRWDKQTMIEWRFPHFKDNLNVRSLRIYSTVQHRILFREHHTILECTVPFLEVQHNPPPSPVIIYCCTDAKRMRPMLSVKI